MDLKIYPTIMDVLEQIIFLDKFFWDVGDFDVSVFRAGCMGLEVKQLISKLENRALGLEMTMLATNLTLSREPVLVPTSPYVDSRAVFYSLLGLSLQTTLV